MASLVLVLLLVWTVIHGANYFLRPSKAQSLLPTPQSFGRRRDRNNTQVILNKFHLRVQTSAWNSRHDGLAKAVSERQGARLRSLLTSFYNVGCVMGVLGTVVALGLMVWNCANTLLPLLQGTLSKPTTPTGLLKRELELAEETAARNNVIQPLVCLLAGARAYTELFIHSDPRSDRTAKPPGAHPVGCFPLSNHSRARACRLRCAVSRA